MRSLRFSLLLASFAAGGPGVLVACQGDDNALPLPADAGSSDARAGDATVGAADSGHDAAGNAADAAALDASSDALSQVVDAEGGAATMEAGDL